MGTSAQYTVKTSVCSPSSFWITRLCTTTWNRSFFTCSRRTTPRGVIWSDTSPRWAQVVCRRIDFSCSETVPNPPRAFRFFTGETLPAKVQRVLHHDSSTVPAQGLRTLPHRLQYVSCLFFWTCEHAGVEIVCCLVSVCVNVELYDSYLVSQSQARFISSIRPFI